MKRILNQEYRSIHGAQKEYFFIKSLEHLGQGVVGLGFFKAKVNNKPITVKPINIIKALS